MFSFIHVKSTHCISNYHLCFKLPSPGASNQVPFIFLSPQPLAQYFNLEYNMRTLFVAWMTCWIKHYSFSNESCISRIWNTLIILDLEVINSFSELHHTIHAFLVAKLNICTFCYISLFCFIFTDYLLGIFFIGLNLY